MFEMSGAPAAPCAATSAPAPRPGSDLAPIRAARNTTIVTSTRPPAPVATRIVSVRLATLARLAPVSDATLAPHSLQKRALGESGALQRAHSPAVSGVAHSEQNFPVPGAPQDGQIVDGEGAVLMR